MKKQIVKLFMLIIYFCFISLLIYADNSLDNWGYYKNITLTGDGSYKYVFLDKEVYRYADSSLKDIRIVDMNNEFVPYYFSMESREENTEELMFSSVGINTSHDDEGNSIFDFHFLPILDEEVRGKKIIFDIFDSNFSKQVIVYGREERSDWIYITKDTIYNIDGIIKNEIEFNSIKNYDLYRIKIIENNNEVLIRNCTLYYNALQESYLQFVKIESLEYIINLEENLTVIEINNPNCLRLRNLKFTINENFDRTYKIFKVVEEELVKLHTGRMYYMQFKDISIIYTEVDFSSDPVTFENIVVKIDNQDNRPLNIEEIYAEYFVDKIVFEDIGTGPYALYFGNELASMPEYDIVEFKTYIENEQQQEESLEAIVILREGEIKADDSADYKLIFNILIISIAVILLIFIILVLKKR